jgi:hypothetical protein
MLKGILAISGQPGLFKLVAEAKNRIIVESLLTGKRMPASPTAKISSLEDIAVYTKTSDMPLKDVLKKIHEHENGGQAISSKSNDNELKKYFGSIISDYDKDRVYISDIKKIFIWYNILQENNLLDFSEEEAAETTNESAPSDKKEEISE